MIVGMLTMVVVVMILVAISGHSGVSYFSQSFISQVMYLRTAITFMFSPIRYP